MLWVGLGFKGGNKQIRGISSLRVSLPPLESRTKADANDICKKMIFGLGDPFLGGLVGGGMGSVFKKRPISISTTKPKNERGSRSFGAF